ncbi:amidohydrolase [Bradyrhizobium liaoningense]|uniref:amidohydrolase n=1 Tax=Bradyrhizobium liaoningense TaxID=43992 RepID=UPI001BADE679|nr:amidohydrolase [Bradyrhizobium liaoningense]MBR0988037.1 amidohydrolase [Bradyrhizobium liaoningense]
MAENQKTIDELFDTADVPPPPADTVFLNGRIYTVDADHPWAEAVAIKDGKFTFVGSDSEARTHIGADTIIVDLQQKMAMPGLHDAHQHLIKAQHRQIYCQVDPDSRVPEIVAACIACSQDHQFGGWIVADVYRGDRFPDGYAHRKYIDEAFPKTPVYLREWSYHHGLANTAALKIAGVTRNTPDPEGGTVLRDHHGEPTGELLSKATWLVTQHIPPLPRRTIRAALLRTAALASQYGITSTQDAAASQSMLSEIKALDEEGKWPLLTAAHIVWGNSASALMSEEAIDHLIRDRTKYRTKHLLTDYVKIYVDGSPLQPHATDVDIDADGRIDVDRLYVKPNKLAEAVARFDRMGIKVKMHAVGTGATLTALEAIEAARKKNGFSGILHDIAHSLRYREQDLDRPSKAGAVMEMSPAIWQIKGDLTKNLAGAWQFKSLRDQGALLTLGSDWVVLPVPNLFPGLAGLLDHGPESIDLKSAIEMATINGAKSVGWDKFNGSIVPGKFANMIVLDRNLFEIASPEIADTRVLTTIFEGRTVYHAS